MTLSYKKWFSVKFVHEFFNHDDDTITDLFLEPAADTLQDFFYGTNWLQRFIGDTLYVLTKEDTDGKPVSPVPIEKFFRFYLTCINHLFFNYTDIDSRISKDYILYLSNFANNEIDSVLNLSVVIPPYDSYTDVSTHSFYPGDLVTDATGFVYECIVQSINHFPADTDFWLKRTQKQYISNADILRVSPANYQYNFSNDIKSVEATVYGFKVDGNALIPYKVLTTNKSFSQALNNVQVDLSLLNPGRYKIVLSAIKALDDSIINNEEIIYYDPVINFKRALGVVEIFNCLNTTNHYSQVDNTGIIKDEKGFEYIIAFANRTAWWNYIAKTSAVTGIHSTIAELDFTQDAINDQLFVSNVPLPFVRQFDYSAFTVTGPSPPQTIPFPSPSVLKSQTGDDGLILKVFTEVYLNY